MLASFSIAISGVKASKYIHQCLLESTLRSRISTFEKTTSASFLNRFSSDMNIIDLVIHFTLRSCINIILQVLFIGEKFFRRDKHDYNNINENIDFLFSRL